MPIKSYLGKTSWGGGQLDLPWYPKGVEDFAPTFVPNWAQTTETKAYKTCNVSNILYYCDMPQHEQTRSGSNYHAFFNPEVLHAVL